MLSTLNKYLNITMADVKTVLGELGLSEGEIKVYMALLKLGSSPVSALKEETNLHRTTIYDFIEKLLNKSLVTYVVRNNTNYYSATDPKKLADFLNEKAAKLNEIMPELVKLSEFKKEDLKVEVFKGIEGYKTLLGMILRSSKDLYGIGFEEERYEKLAPDAMRTYFRQTKEKNIHEHIFVKENAAFRYNYENVHYKTLPPEFFNPNSIMTFGKFVAIQLWDPLNTIVIEHKPLADAYKKWFEMLWNQKFSTHTGVESVKNIFESHLKELKKGDELLVFGSSAHIPDSFFKYFQTYNAPLVMKGIKPKIIFDEDAKKLIGPCKKAGWNVRTLPKKYVSPVEVDLWNDKVAMIIWKKEPIAFTIEDKELVNGFKAFFNLQWDTAKKA